MAKLQETRSSNGYTNGGRASSAKSSKWEAVFERKAAANRIDINVHLPVTAPVGMWRLTLETWYGGRRFDRSKYKSDEAVYILFNPFNEGNFNESGGPEVREKKMPFQF